MEKKQSNEWKYYNNCKNDYWFLMMFGLITLVTGMIISNTFIIALAIAEFFFWYCLLQQDSNRVYTKEKLDRIIISKQEYEKNTRGEKTK